MSIMTDQVTDQTTEYDSLKEKYAELIELLSELDQLGADEIRKMLWDNRLCGEPGTMFRCPIAIYLHRQLHCLVGVDDDRVWIGPRGNAEKGVLVPRAVFEFIQAFDDGKYPELETRTGLLEV